MSTVTKLTQEEIDQIKTLKSRHAALKEELAQVGMTELNIKLKHIQIEKFFSATLDLEKDITSKLQAKYGDGTIDLEKGEFTAKVQ